MALVRCPECGREVSDRARSCIHCGFPMNEPITQKTYEDIRPNNICIINGTRYDLSDLKDYVLDEQRNKEVNPHDKAWELMKIIPGFTGPDAFRLMAEIQNTRCVPNSFYTSSAASNAYVDDTVRCPKCRSSSVVTGQRGYSMMWGFMGSNRTMNRCAKCGYKWEPKR